MTKQNVIDNVQASLGSLFTKDDVINILNMVKEQPAPAPATDYIEMLRLTMERVHDMARQFDWDDKSVIKVEDVELTLTSSNRIEIDEYTIDATDLKDNFLYELGVLYNDLKVEHEQRVEIVNENN